VLIDRIDMKKSSEKREIKERRKRVTLVHVRMDKCFSDRLSEADSNILAGVFAIEENALRLCEEGEVSKAISLLKEQDGAMVPLAITILERLRSQ
jgi:hypothetical protein